jgi:hypothetical protein
MKKLVQLLDYLLMADFELIHHELQSTEDLLSVVGSDYPFRWKGSFLFDV